MLVCQAPAKVNLGLVVQRRRDDGYHDLSTIFLKISLADTLCLESTSGEIRIECDHPEVPCDERNLVYQAAAALQEQVPNQGVRVQLHKRIPVAAGLGGGSSDAAATLLGLNTLWNLQLTALELNRYAARLGADVPFFLLPGLPPTGLDAVMNSRDWRVHTPFFWSWSLRRLRSRLPGSLVNSDLS